MADKNTHQNKELVLKFEQLQTAKHNVIWLIDHANSTVDMHGLEYWAGQVERLREQIKESL